MGRRIKEGVCRYSVYYMVLGINLVSILALSLFNYVVFHNNSKRLYRESFESYNQKNIDMAFHNMDQQIIQLIYNIPKIYFSQIQKNEPILRPQEENIMGHAAEIRELTMELQSLQMSYPVLESLDIYYENTDTVVTGFSNVHFPSGEEEFKRYLPWYSEFREQGKDFYFMRTSDVYPLGEPAMSYICRISQPRWKEKSIVVALHIAPSVFSDYIDETAGKLTVTVPEGNILYSSGEEQETPEGDTTVFSYDSPATSLCYTYDMADYVLYADVNSKNQVFLLNFFLSVLFNVGLLMVISHYSGHVYQKKLISLSEDAGMTLGTDHGNFDSSLKQLQKEIHTLHDAANSSKTLRFQSAVRALILNRKTGETMPLLETYLTYDRCRVLMIQHTGQELEKISLEQLQEQFEKDGADAGYHILFTTMEKGEIVAVINCMDDNADEALRDAEEKLGACFEGGRIVSGNCVMAETDEIRKAYRAVCEASRYWFIYPETRFLSQKELGMEKRKENGSHLKLFEAIEKDINSENLLEFKLHMEMLVTSFKNGNYSINYCYSTCRDLVTLIYRIIQHRGLDMWVMYGYDIREYYKGIDDIDSFQDWLDSVGEVLLKNIRQRRRQADRDGDLKTQLTELIEEKLENGISLDYLCDRLDMRPDALSRIFKQVMGEGYADYVKKRKLERAIELMDEDYSIKDIAEKLGYSSSQYFIKVFKEVYGSTPHQYKKNRRAEEERK